MMTALLKFNGADKNVVFFYEKVKYNNAGL